MIARMNTTMRTLSLVLLCALAAAAQTPAPLIEPSRFEPQPASLGDAAALVISVAYSPDGELLATGSADKTVKLWEPATGKLLATLEGHTDGVAGLAFSADSKQLASASYDKSVRLWDVTKRHEVRTFLGHKNWVVGLAFSPDQTTLVSASHDRTLIAWNLSTGQAKHTFAGHKGPVRAVGFSPDGTRLVSASSDRTVRVWPWPMGGEPTVLQEHTAAVRGLAFAPDGTLASCGEDNRIVLWNLATGEKIRELTGHTDLVFAVAFSPRGKLLASGSFDKTVKLWNPADGTEQATLEGHTDGVAGLAFAPGGRQLATAAADNSVFLWTASLPRLQARHTTKLNLGTRAVAARSTTSTLAIANDNLVTLYDERGEQVRSTLKGHRGTIVHLAFSPDGAWLVSSARDRTARLWHVATGTTHAVLDGHRGAVIAADFSPDGRTLLTASSDKTILVWDVPALGSAPAPLRERATWTGAAGPFVALAWAPDGKSVVSLSAAAGKASPAEVRWWNPTDGTPLGSVPLTGDGLCLASAADSTTVAVGCTDGTLRLLDGKTRTVIAQRRQRAPVRAVHFVPGGRGLLSATAGGSIVWWDANGWREQAGLIGHSVAVNTLTVTAGSVLTLAQDGALKLWDLEPKTIPHLKASEHTGWVTAALFLPDGKRTLTASWDLTLKLWDEPAKEPAVWEGHKDHILALALSPDGKFALSGSADRTAKLWNIADGKDVRTFTGHKGAVESVAFFPDGKRCVTGSRAGEVCIWDVASGTELLSLAKVKESIRAVAVTPDGRRVYVAAQRRILGLDVDGESGVQFPVQSSPVLALAIAPDGKTLVSGGMDRTAIVWSVGGQALHTLAGHVGYVRAVAFSPDGKRLFSASYDGTVRQWNPATGQSVGNYELHDKPVLSLGVRADGQRVVTGDSSGNVCWWEVPRP
jgi:WD40 repeat protein